MSGRFRSGVGRLCGAVVASGLLSSCAHVEAPPGGPEDTQPPYVVAVFPAPGSHDVPREAAVTLKFSEWIDRGTGLGQVLLSPPLPGKLKVGVEGDRLLIRLPDAFGGLRRNTAYRISVLGSLKDLHGNSMGPAFSLAFTTGTGFDSGAVAGRVDAPDRKGTVVVALYRVNDRDTGSVLPRLLNQEPGFRPDSLPAPARELPSFVISADSLGAFAFDSVTQGRYAVLAFEDLNGNLTPDFGFEPMGVGAADLPLTPRAPKQFLHLASLDTALLRVAAVHFTADSTDSTAKDSLRGVLRVKFTHPPRPDSAADAGRYHLTALPKSGSKEDSAGAMKNGPVSFTSVGWDAASGEWVLETPSLRRNARYRLEVKGISDTLHAAREFAASVSSDTGTWALAFLDPPDASGLPQLAAGDALPAREYRLRSNRSLNPARWRMLEDRLETRVDTSSVKAALQRRGPVELSLRLEKPPRGGQNLQLRLKPAPPDSVPQPLAAAHILDSLKQGALRFRAPASLKGWTFLLQAQSSPGERALKSESDSVLFAPLAAGRYRLAAFQDRDGDGAWSPGALHPWTPQEPYAILLDSVDVPAADTATDITPRLQGADAGSSSKFKAP